MSKLGNGSLFLARLFSFRKRRLRNRGNYSEGFFEAVEGGFGVFHGNHDTSLHLPWQKSPYSLISLFTIMRYTAERLIGITQKITNAVRSIEASSTSSHKIPPAAQRTCLDFLKKLEDDCQQLSLGMCIEKIERIKSQIHAMTFMQLAHQYAALYERFYDEIKSTMFLYVGKDRQQFYTQPLIMFGEDLADKFSIIHDVEEAGKSYAIGRNTACVFHLMRIMESGLRHLCGEASTYGISIPDPACNRSWDGWLKPIESELRKDRKLKQSEWNSIEPVYAQVVSHIRTVSVAWRNPTMHVGIKYTGEEALDIFNATRGFMRHLFSSQLRKT